MKNRAITLGIIAEYNPFHHGHAYQLRTLKTMTEAQTVIVLMSGNVVQRGEFAIVDKWRRAEAALKSGADLVIEAPIVASLQGADYFANYNVRLLHQLGITTLGFGTETASTQELRDFVHWQMDHTNDIDQHIQTALLEGMSYAASHHYAINQLGYHPSFDISSPNHLLAIQYIQAIEKYYPDLEGLALPRLNSQNGQTVLSGSAIRQALQEDSEPEQLVPQSMAKLLEDSYFMDWQIAYPFLRYRLAQHQPESLRSIWGIREGIEHLILKNIYLTTDYAQFLDNMISKRWTKSSIQRILMSVLLDITVNEWQNWEAQFKKQPAVQVLGFTESGRQYLNGIKKQRQVKMVSNINRQTAPFVPGNLKADAIMQMISLDAIQEQNYTRKPIIIK